MEQKFGGSLTLDWYNKQKSIILQDENSASPNDIPAPRINWVNKDQALFYEIDENEGKGIKPYWVDRNDLRVKEARPLIFQKAFLARKVDEDGNKPKYELEESDYDDPTIENILIKGDNLLALNTLKKMFDKKPDEEKVKCIYIDPPYNTGSAFEEYDDNIAHSEWLTLMRDRLIILKELLAVNGIILVQISDVEESYLKILLDELFGRENFINKITLKTKSPSGFQTVNLGVFETAEYIFIYAKDKNLIFFNPIYVECDYDKNYNRIIPNHNDKPEDWKVLNLCDFVAKIKGFTTVNDARKKLGKYTFDKIVADFAIQNASRVFRFTEISDKGAAKSTVELKYESLKNENKIFIEKRDNYSDRFILNGKEITFYAKKVKFIDGKMVPSMPLTNIWKDISWEGIANEGNVKFKKSKKPERLLRRILQMITSKNDFVLDCFAGSGTTLAVAQKMNRKWIGVEIANHSDTHIIKRLKLILNGSDKSGISDLENWQGGGSFKYYYLGSSVINYATNDFNWLLSRKFIEESLLSSYDYTLDLQIDLRNGEFFTQEALLPTVGFQANHRKVMAAVISLNEPEGNRDFMSYEEIKHIYEKVKEYKAPHAITIFTNRGVEIAYDAKPDELEIVKIPQAIFAELEK